MRNFICVVVLSMLAGNVLAGAEDGQGYFSVMGSYVDDDTERGVDDGFNGGQFSLGKALSQTWNFEVLYMTSRAGSANGDWRYTGIGFDLQRVFMRDETFSPYIFGGMGSFQADGPNSEGGTGGMMSAGLGFYVDLFGSNTALRAEWRMRKDKAQSIAYTDNIVSLGLHLPFGSKSTPVVVATVDGDADNDGVTDSNDQCPNTPAGISVDSNGCALDSDGDGVPNSNDHCANTVAGAAVDENGCELDSDGDRVVDRLDECPDTPAGTPVDKTGCEIKGDIVLHGVNFESNSDRVLAGATAVLDDVVAAMERNPTIKIEIGGHTDSIGGEEANASLSARRAQTVHDYLAANGVDVNRMSVRGYGESEPIADNETDAGRAQNRRVVLRITER